MHPQYHSLVTRTWELGDLMCTAAGFHLFTTVAVVSHHREILAIAKGWNGGEPTEASRADRIGPTKALELLVNLDGNFVMTPTGSPLGTGWMGGVRRLSEDGDVHYVTSCSAWSEQCDAMMAVLLNHSMTWETRFHHVGYRHPTKASAEAIVATRESTFGTKAIFLPTDEHARWYVPVLGSRAPNGVYWEEHQWWPDAAMQNYAVHWDVASSDADGLLGMLSAGLMTVPKRWEPVENDPIGAIWQDNKGVPYGVFARERWWQVS